MPCSNPNLAVPAGPAPAAIPGFGVPFAPTTPSGVPSVPSGQPEDLNAIFDAIQFIVPSGTIKPPLSLNYDRTVFDAIMKVMEIFTPFLMLYKMILPVLRIIVCIIEVICAIPNPFKLIEKIQQLFRVCIPEFLALFPQFALIVIILSIINLLITLVEYIITEVAKLVAIIQSNINTIKRALTVADDRSILSATAKIGAVLCSFQNLFVLLSVFDALVSIIKTILKLLFPIPPCGDNNNNDINCCTPDVCPAFIKNNTDINRSTGTLQYYNEVSVDSGLILPPGFNLFTSDIRKESWQFYDAAAPTTLAFYNITQAYDLPANTTAIFFPTDANITASTPPSQAPYLVDLRVFYNPTPWGVVDLKGPRYIRINNCIVLSAPTNYLSSYDNSHVPVANGVVSIAGGLVYEDDNTTPVIRSGVQATLNTLLHMDATTALFPPPLSSTDGYVFTNITYDFKIQHAVLLSKALITLGCVPSVTIDRTFINTIFGGPKLLNFNLPDVAGAQTCLSTAVAGLQSSVSDQSLATFQATATTCLNNLKDQAVAAGIQLIDAGFDPYKSSFTISPSTQFTTLPIVITVTLVESSGVLLASNISSDIANSIAKNITAEVTFGKVDSFVYDGYSLFTANLTATTAGSGTIKISYQNQVISTITLPTDLSQPPTVTETVLPYSFIFSPLGTSNRTGEGDTEGAPRLGASDISIITGD